MVAQTHPFKPIPEKLDMPWEGVHQADTLRDDPDHPHSLFGEGHKNTFQEGGIIPDAAGFGQQQALTANAFGQQTALDARARRRPATTQVAPVVPPLPAQANTVSRSGRRNRFADGGKISHEDVLQNAENNLANAVDSPLSDKGAQARRLADSRKAVKFARKQLADKQTSGTKDITAGTASARLRGRALQIENAERAAQGLPPLTKDSKK